MLRPLLLALGVALRADGRTPAEDDSTALIQMAQMALARRTGAEDVEELFHASDADHSGGLSLAELTTYLRGRWSAEMSPAQVRKIMRKSDANVDWSLSLDEFLGCASDPSACDGEAPQAPAAPQAAPSSGLESALVASSGGPSSDVGLTDFLPDELTSALRPSQVERCTQGDREVLRQSGLSVQREEVPEGQRRPRPASWDPVLTQAVQIRGAWVQTFILPDACRGALSHVGRLDRSAHAQCLQDSLNITLSCSKCHANFMHDLVHNCATSCMPSMSSSSCLECSKPMKLLECVMGRARIEEMQLGSSEIVGERDEGGDTVVIGADTPTGELIVAPRHVEEAKPPAEDTEETASVDPLALEETSGEGQEEPIDTSEREEPSEVERESIDPFASEESIAEVQRETIDPLAEMAEELEAEAAEWESTAGQVGAAEEEAEEAEEEKEETPVKGLEQEVEEDAAAETGEDAESA